MFFIISTIIFANVFLMPYYFTSQFEYFIINCIIPFINNIYITKNQKRIIEIKIFTESKNEPINFNILNDNNSDTSDDFNYKIDIDELESDELDELDELESEELDETEESESEESESEDTEYESEETECEIDTESDDVNSETILIEIVE